MTNTGLTQQALKYKPTGRTHRGRPRERRSDEMRLPREEQLKLAEVQKKKKKKKRIQF
jgi:hypothetical protein